jgi:nicotinamidase-related amidase
MAESPWTKTDKNDLNPDYLNVDPLKATYASSINQSLKQIEKLPDTIALLCIDMQYLDAAQDVGMFADAARTGAPLEAQEYYFSTLHRTVLPNVRRLQDCFRAHGLEVIHIRIQSLTRDGRDRSKGHKRLHLLAAPGSREAAFREEVAPLGDEIVINKTASGVFSSTNLYYVLNNLGINALFITGVYTNECVSTSARDASDLGFLVTLIEDGCTTVTPELHNFTLATLRDRYVRVVDTEQAIEEIERQHQGAPVIRVGP